MPPAGYPAFLQYLQSGRVRKFSGGIGRPPAESDARADTGLAGSTTRKRCNQPAVHEGIAKYLKRVHHLER